MTAAHRAIAAQYRATLAMMRQAIERCPSDLWIAGDSENAFWRVAYHALFAVDLYLAPREADFVPWPGHRPEHEHLGPAPFPPYHEPQIGAPFAPVEVLGLLQHVARRVEEQVPVTDLTAPSGFHWLGFDKMELQIYSIRHLQTHVGELASRLARREIATEWVGTVAPGQRV